MKRRKRYDTDDGDDTVAKHGEVVRVNLMDSMQRRVVDHSGRERY